MSTAQRDPVEDQPGTRVAGELATGPRQRGRSVSGPVAVVGSVLAVLALVVGGTAALRMVPAKPPPEDAPPGTLHLPRTVHTPGTWSDDEGPRGPLAAVGLALRTSPEGLTGQRQRLQLFGVSAVDGRSAWVTLPGVDLAERALVGWFALSPDGRWVAWSRQEEPPAGGGSAPLLGWAVMDTTTGDVRELSDPAAPGVRSEASDLVFSGDSRYLLTSYERPDAPRAHGHRFVAWDVHDGTPTVLERPGHYWLPNPGTSPTGVVWSRAGTVYRQDPETGGRSSNSFPQSVVAASWAPDDRAFAYIGDPAGRRTSWKLHAGASLAAARRHVVPLKMLPQQLLGWRDDRHVVVGHFRSAVDVVDVVTGHAVQVDLAGYGEPLNAPLLAGDLWRNPLREPAEPSGTTDPRSPYRRGGGVLLALLAGSLLVKRGRARARA